MGDFEDKLKEIQDKFTSQVERHREEVERAEGDIFGRRRTAPPTSHFSPLASHTRTMDLARAGYLDRLDDVAEECFHFQQWLGGSLRQYPTVYCETLEEYYQPFLELLSVSGTSQQAILEELKAKAQAEAERSGGGEFGVHWPGRGCYLNGWLFAYNKTSDAMSALKNPQILPSILATAAHEKFGHGFITECTAWGQEKKSIQLWRYDIARRFGRQLSDTPREALLAEKWSAIFDTSRFCEEGYATWIEGFLLRQFAKMTPDGAGAAPAVPRYSVDSVLGTLRQIGAGADDAATKDVMEKVTRDVELLFGPGPVESQAIQEALLELSQFDDMFSSQMASAFGQPFRYILGLLLVEKIARSWGDFCVPYAVLLATHVTYDIDSIPVADLRLVVEQDARLNIDARLAMLSFLHGERSGDPRALARAAQEQLNLAAPQALA